MKKLTLVLLMASAIICFASCGKDIEPKPTVKNEINQAEANTENTEKPKIISVNKGIVQQYEFYEDETVMAKSEASYVLLDDHEREIYPNLAATLDETSVMCINSMDDEFDNLVAFANEQLSAYDGFNTQVSSLDVQVRRADSIVFSVLADSYLDTEYIKDARFLNGTVYDTQSGKKLLITDVITDMSVLPEIAEEKLTSYMGTFEFLSETAIKDYFERTPADGISFTVDYNGVTIYFNPCDIAESYYGNQTVTVPFDEYPEIFTEKYIHVPDAYAVRIPLNAPGYFDLDGDKKPEELIVSTFTDEEYDFYSQLYIATSSDFYEENFFSYGFNPYFMKTADGHNLLYIFSEGSDSWNRLMRLHIYDLTGGKIQKLDETSLAPHHHVNNEGTDIFSVPTNPEKMHFDYFVNEEGFLYPSSEEYCNVGSDGLPEFLGDGIMMDYPYEKEITESDSLVPYKDSEYRTVYANALDFESAEGVPYFAVAFIGYGEDLHNERDEYIKAVFPNLDESLISAIEHFDFEGDEWYLVVPRYKEYVDIESPKEGKTETVYQGEAFTVRCNLSDLHSNIKISTDIHGGHYFNPQIDGAGLLVTTDDVMDITIYG